MFLSLPGLFFGILLRVLLFLGVLLARRFRTSSCGLSGRWPLLGLLTFIFVLVLIVIILNSAKRIRSRILDLLLRLILIRFFLLWLLFLLGGFLVLLILCFLWFGGFFVLLFLIFFVVLLFTLALL